MGQDISSFKDSNRGCAIGKKTVLVIEDNEMNMRLITAVMKVGNYQMLKAKDAETGLRLPGASSGSHSEGDPAPGYGWFECYADHQK